MKVNKNHLSFDDMRVAYLPKDDVIQITSGDQALAADGWRLVLQKHTPGEKRLRTLLQHEGVLRFPTANLPNFIAYPAKTEQPWHEFPVGVKKDGSVATIDLLTSPHLLLAGSSGSGKSAVLRSLMAHVLNHPNRWQVTAVDMSQIEYGQYKESTTLRERFTYVKDLEGAVMALRKLEELMFQRYAALEATRQNSAVRFINDGIWQAQLIVIDEAYILLSLEGALSQEGKQRDSWHQEARERLANIARLGRAAGIFIVISTQRPDGSILPSEFRNNLGNRILLGRVSSSNSKLVLNSGQLGPATSNMTTTPNIKGRGYLYSDGDGNAWEVQFFWAEPNHTEQFERARYQ